MDLTRLEYLVYRCYTCGGPLTKLEILEKWEEAEATGALCRSLCPCGGNKLVPGNFTPEEEAELGTPELEERYLAGERSRETRLWELFYTCVKDRNVGPMYGQVEAK